MDNYIVSARKYRPATFDSVVGQRALTTTLKNAIASGKLAHAYLFCGPRGVGKTTCARIFAKTINCLSPKENGEACGVCESCQAFDENRSLNIFELDAASNNSVDDIRALIEQTTVPPQVGKYKVFIIDEVHMLSAAAFNAFLKTLEEPPAHVIFILATTEKQKILPTILSRCQIYDFNRMEIGDIVAHLRRVAEQEGISCEEDALSVIAEKADGGMRDALSIFDQVASFANGDITYQKVVEDLNILDYDYYFRVTEQLLKRDIAGALLTLDNVLGRGFGGNLFIGGLARHFRNLLVCQNPQTLPLLEVGGTVRQRYADQAPQCKPQFLYKALRLCNDCDVNYRASNNKRLLVELTLIELAQAATDEEPGSGLGPKKKLNPIFQAAPVARQTAPAPTTTPQSTATPATPAPQPASSTASPAAPTPHKTTAPQPAGRLRQTVSLAALLHKPTPAPKAQATVAAAEAPENYGNKPIDPDRLGYYWLRFASELPRDDAALAGRMQNLRPTLLDGNVIEVAVDNPMVLRDFNVMKPRLTEFFRRECGNGDLIFSFRLSEADETQRAYSRRDIFQDMVTKNPAVAILAKELQLEVQ